MPPNSRIEALARTCNLDDAQRFRLGEALGRWFASDVAASMAAFNDLRAEAPFFVAVPAESPGLDAGTSTFGRAEEPDEAFLEGEIDLIGLSDDGRSAIVVDYKTGGSDWESSDTLVRKHVLQAACYAYAVMLQGVEKVEAVFVRVERPRGGDASQPQCVRYRFAAEDLPTLESAIARAYGQARKTAMA